MSAHSNAEQLHLGPIKARQQTRIRLQKAADDVKFFKKGQRNGDLSCREVFFPDIFYDTKVGELDIITPPPLVK